MTGGGDRVPSEPKNKLFCMECKVPVRLMQHFLWLDGGHTGCSAEWEGAIWGHCEPCSGLIASDFKRQQKKKWVARGDALKGRVIRFRSMDFGTCCAIIRKMVPKGSATLVRDLGCLRMRVACLALSRRIL